MTRDYGLGDFTEYIIGRPHIGDPVDIECPKCGAEKTFKIEVIMMNMPLIKSKYCIGIFIGCAACPTASPMMVTAHGDKLPEWFKERKNENENLENL